MKVTSLNNYYRELPNTINIHLTRSCNFNCQFCYAGFGECNTFRIPPDQLQQILFEISQAQPHQKNRKIKVNFAGGEPLLYPGLGNILGICKQLGLTTSLVTNGSLLDEAMMAQFSGTLDICAISMDIRWNYLMTSPGIPIARCPDWANTSGRKWSPAGWWWNNARITKSLGSR